MTDEMGSTTLIHPKLSTTNLKGPMILFFTEGVSIFQGLRAVYRGLGLFII
jgi:hypothetical protein